MVVSYSNPEYTMLTPHCSIQHNYVRDKEVKLRLGEYQRVWHMTELVPEKNGSQIFYMICSSLKNKIMVSFEKRQLLGDIITKLNKAPMICGTNQFYCALGKQLEFGDKNLSFTLAAHIFNKLSCQVPMAGSLGSQCLNIVFSQYIL